MPFNFLDIPSEIRIQIYELLLADASLIVQYLFIRNGFRSMFRNKTPPALSAQILRTCQQIAREGASILYGKPRFDCSDCINGVEKLQAQIGPKNFGLIKRLTLDSEDVHGVADALRCEPGDSTYRKLECLTTTAHRIVDLSLAGWEFELHVQEMSRLCLSACQILRSSSHLRVLGQVSRKDTSQSYGDAIVASNYRVKWKFARSLSDLGPDEQVLDVERLLDLALLMQRRSGEAILTMGQCATPVPLAHGIQQIMYPGFMVQGDLSASLPYSTNGGMDMTAQHQNLET